MNATLFRRLRQKEGMTQAQFAELLGVSRPTIANIEAGRYNISEHVRARIAKLGLVDNELESFLSQFDKVDQTFPIKP